MTRASHGRTPSAPESEDPRDLDVFNVLHPLPGASRHVLLSERRLWCTLGVKGYYSLCCLDYECR